MKYLLAISSFFLLSVALFAQFPEPQNPRRLVNDFVGMLNQQEWSQLEQKLRNYNDSTSTEVSVVIIQSLGGYDIAQYAAELGEKWGIGKKEKNNGILILIASEDRKMNISTGYGMEATITDAASKRIIEQYLKPNFRNRQYFTGLDQATSIIMALASGEYKADPKGKTSSPVGMIIFVILIIIIFSFFGKNGGGRNYHSGGAGDILTGMLIGSALGRSSGGWGSFSGGSGSFGGFGGGSFGGGGASGDW